MRTRDLIDRLRQSDHLRILGLAALVGIVTGFGAVGFRWLIDQVTAFFWSGSYSPFEVVDDLPLWWRVLIPAAGGLAVGLLIRFYSREVKGHGVPEVMEAITLREGRIRLRVFPAKALASAVTIGTGGSAGREGPIVQIGSAIGSAMGQLSRLPGRYIRILVASGAAGGISATFNTPIAGAIFAAEVILGDFGVSHFTPVVVASVLATAVGRSFFGAQPTFVIPEGIFHIVSVWEFLPYAVLGLLSAVVALLFIRGLHSAVQGFDGLDRVPVWIRPALGGAVLGLMAMLLPEVLGVGYELIEASLSPEPYAPVLILLLIMLGKMLATSFTLGSGGSGGVLSPSLFIGAMLGSVVGTLVQGAPFGTAAPGAYTMVGMGAVLAAATHAPLTAVLMLFELTGNYQIILPMMLACTLATLTAARLQRTSIYTIELARRGISVSRGFETNVLRTIKVREVYSTDAATIPDDLVLSELMDRVAVSSHSRYYLLDKEGRLQGAVEMSDLRKVIPDQAYLWSVVVAADVATADVQAVVPEDDLSWVMHEFERTGADEIPVVDPQEGKLLGTVRKGDVIARYNREMLQRDMAREVHEGLRHAGLPVTVPLDDEHVLAEVEVPPEARGRTLSECAFRRRFGVEVVLVRPAGGGAPRVPAGETVLEEENTLLVVGEREAVARLRSGH